MNRIRNAEELIRLVREDRWMTDILEAAGSLDLPDWWVCAGFVRSKAWDTLHGFAQRTPLQDVDVIYFDAGSTDEAEEKRLEARLRRMRPDIPWSVKNEARMHVVNDLPPYLSSVDAMSKFPETATALGLSLNAARELMLAAPHGVEDLLRPAVRPTPLFRESKDLADVYEKRIRNKNWKRIWPLIEVERLPPG